MKKIIYILFILIISCSSLEPPSSSDTGSESLRPMQITKVSASEDVVPPGGTVTLSVFIRNINKDSISYKWTSVTGLGAFLLGDTSSFTQWRAPLEIGEYALRIGVTSHKGDTDSDEILVRVANFSAFYGQVMNYQNEPVKEASVKFRRWEAVTDSSGIFSFNSIPQESDTLKISKNYFVPIDTIITPDSTIAFNTILRVVKFPSPKNFIAEKIRENSVTLFWEPLTNISALKSYLLLKGNSLESLTILRDNIDPSTDHFEDFNVVKDDIFFYKLCCINSENIPGDSALTVYKERMRFIPAGEFEMGSNSGDFDETPVHTVYLDAYFIDTYEVTNKEFAEFLNADINSEFFDKRMRIINDQGRFIPAPGYGNHPILYVDWSAAESYALFRGKRLPTEAEWEKAARGNDMRIYPWGNEISPKHANYATKNHPFNRNIPPTTPVGLFNGKTYGNFETEKGFSLFGVYDMAGNVWEWVQDWYLPDFYSTGSDQNPMSNTIGQDSTKVLRGGGWINEMYFLRSTNRFKASLNFKNNIIGFRCASDTEKE